MSMNVPPNSPLGYYASPYTAPRSGRPTSVTVLAIIGIILGALGVLCAPLAMLPYFAQFGPASPVIDSIRSDRALVGYLLTATLIGMAFNLLLLIASIGALRLKEWARRGMLFYSIASIVLGIIGTVVSFVWIMPKVSAAASGTPEMSGFIGGMIGGLLGLVYPVFVIIYMKRPHVVEAFATGGRPSYLPSASFVGAYQGPYQPPA